MVDPSGVLTLDEDEEEEEDLDADELDSDEEEPAEDYGSETEDVPIVQKIKKSQSKKAFEKAVIKSELPIAMDLDATHYSSVASMINHLLDQLSELVDKKLPKEEDGNVILKKYFTHPVHGEKRYQAFKKLADLVLEEEDEVPVEEEAADETGQSVVAQLESKKRTSFAQKLLRIA